MRIIGQGIDIQDMRRVERLLSNPHNDWIDGVFTDAEQTTADAPPNTVQYYAGRYAAKEAVAKALGTGFTDEVTCLDIEVRRKPSGAPEVHLTGGAAEIARSLGVASWLVSFSHSGEYAVASVIATSEG
jgi:holo-[acyl-carrier protein] synthase